MHRIVFFCTSMLLWIVFSGKFDWFHLSMGVGSALLVTATTSDFFWGMKSSPQGRFRFSAVIKGIGYFFWLLYEIYLSSVHVFKLALYRDVKNHIQPQIVRFKTKLNTDLGRWALANSITLTPGTVTLKIEGDEFVVHAISDQTAAGLPGTMEEKVREVFEP